MTRSAHMRKFHAKRAGIMSGKARNKKIQNNGLQIKKNGRKNEVRKESTKKYN